MKRRVVIACDSFKGCLTAEEVCEAVAAGLAAAGREGAAPLPLADGGEGTARILTRALGGEWVECESVDPLLRPIRCTYGVKGDTAIMDVATASGLTLLPEDERNPLIATSYGTGLLIKDAVNRGCHNIIIGLGGSATNDGGRGLLEALGISFFDAEGEPLRPGVLELARLECVEGKVPECNITALADVDNPLCGPNGATAVFGPQKGVTVEMVGPIDRALGHFAEVVLDEQVRRAAITGRAYQACPPGVWGLRAAGREGAAPLPLGAAGGIGFALGAMCNARVVSGVEEVLRLTGFDEAVRGADLVITGEGRMDLQTLYGKVPMGVLRHCQAAGMPCVGIAGQVTDREMLLKAGFVDVVAVTPEGMAPEEAMRPEVARENLRHIDVSRTAAGREGAAPLHK